MKRKDRKQHQQQTIHGKVKRQILMRRSACLRSANGTKATKTSTVKLPKLRSSNRNTNNGTKRFDCSGSSNGDEDSSGDDKCNQKFISLV